MKIRTDTTGWELTTNRLTVRVAKPGFIYRRTRFDWTAFITDVILDGRHTFCSTESLHPLEGAGGIGLCSEFGIHEPIGYEEAGIGENFPKLGVGLLRKESDESYFFMKDYSLEPFPCEITQLPDGLAFEQSPILCRGYAARLKKTLTIKDNMLHIGYQWENTGVETIRTTEYCHNFVQIDQQPVGSDYDLTFSSPLTFSRNDGSIWSSNGHLTWNDGIPGFYASCMDVPRTGPIWWELWNKTAGAGLREELDTPVCRIACWGMQHVVSAEMFKSIDLARGETDSWSRSYTFMANPEKA